MQYFFIRLLSSHFCSTCYTFFKFWFWFFGLVIHIFFYISKINMVIGHWTVPGRVLWIALPSFRPDVFSRLVHWLFLKLSMAHVLLCVTESDFFKKVTKSDFGIMYLFSRLLGKQENMKFGHSNEDSFAFCALWNDAPQLTISFCENFKSGENLVFSL